jgi:hypothetical protein
LLDRLKALYRPIEIAHTFASPQAGVAFAVSDGLARLRPASWRLLGRVSRSGVSSSTLEVRGTKGMPPIRRADGFVDTGGLLTLWIGRQDFMGRSSGGDQCRGA